MISGSGSPVALHVKYAVLPKVVSTSVGGTRISGFSGNKINILLYCKLHNEGHCQFLR